MNMTARYFAYHFRSTLVRFAVTLLFSSIICYYFCLEHYRFENNRDYYSVNLSFPVVILMILAYALAASELAPFKNRRNLDLWMSSPLSRTQIILVNVINGALQLTITFLVTVLICLVKMFMYSGSSTFDAWQIVVFFFVALPIILIVYVFNCAVFTIANSVMDGIIFMLMYLFLPTMINGVYETVRHWIGSGYRYSDNAVYSASVVAGKIANAYSYRCKPDGYRYNNISLIIEASEIPLIYIVWYLIWVMIGAGSLILAVIYFNKMRPEKAGGPSTNFFGYTLLLPLLGYMFLIIAAGSSWIVSMFILMAMFFGYVIFRKGFKLKIPDIIMLGAGVLITTAFKIVL